MAGTGEEDSTSFPSPSTGEEDSTSFPSPLSKIPLNYGGDGGGKLNLIPLPLDGGGRLNLIPLPLDGGGWGWG